MAAVESPEQTTPARAPPRLDRRWKGVLALLVAGAFLLGLALGSYFPVPPPAVAAACTGQRLLSGTVVDQDRLPLAGVVGVVQPTPPNNGVQATVTTSSTGRWTALVSGGCPYDALFYWQSAQSGPLLAIRSGISSPVDLQVGVASQAVDLLLFAEYPNSSNVSVTANVSAGVVFSLPALRFGNLTLRFLPSLGPLGWGETFTLPQDVDFTTHAPMAIEISAAEAYRVEDASGDWAVYAVPGNGSWSVVSVFDNMTAGQGIGLDYLNGLYPYASAAGHGSTGFPLAIGSADPLWAGVGTPVFNVTLPSYLSRPAGASVRASVLLVNSGSSNNFYAFYQAGPAAHVWFCGSGATVPPFCGF